MTISQDVFSGCKPTSGDHVVAGTMQMNGFSSSTGGTGGEPKISMGLSFIGLTPRDLEGAGNPSPTRIHAKDLFAPNRFEARDAAPTWLINGAQFTLVLQHSQTPGYLVPSSLAQILANNLMNDWKFKPAGHNTAYERGQ